MMQNSSTVLFHFNTIESSASKCKGSPTSDGSQPHLFQCLPAVDPHRVESGLIILRIPHDIILEAAVYSHMTEYTHYNLGRQSWLWPAVDTLLHHLRSSAVTKVLSDKWKTRLGYILVYVICWISMGKICRASTKLSL